MAGDADLDLVKISPKADPPVCKLMDYGKVPVRAEQAGEGGQRKTSAMVEIKEVRMSPGIDVKDFNVKLRNSPEVPGRRQPGQGLLFASVAVRWPIPTSEGSVCWKKFAEPTAPRSPPWTRSPSWRAVT